MALQTAQPSFVIPENDAGIINSAATPTFVTEVQSEDKAGTSRLPAVLGTRDLTVLMLLIVLFIANNNGVQFGGPAAFLYWGLGLLTFLVPCAYVTQWLAQRFPGQGAPYLWAARILGPRWSFFSAFCAWLPGVLAVVSAIESGLIFIQYVTPTWFTTPATQGVAIVLILLIPTGLACLPLRWLKHILLVVATLYVGVFLFLGIAGGWWLLHGQAPAIALDAPGVWLPTGGNFAVYGIVILAFLGADIPIFMGGEIRGGKAYTGRATSYVWWGTALSFVAYVVGTFGIMVIVPPSQAGGMAANVLAIQMVFGPLVGKSVAIVLAISQIALTIAYILMFSRLLVVVAQDRRLPGRFAQLNRHGVPVLSIVIQAATVALVTILSLVFVPNFFGTLLHPDDLAFAIYNVLQAGTTVVWVCTIIQLFGLVLWLLYRRGVGMDVSKRQRVLLVSMALIGIMASFVGIWATVSSSWLPSIIPNQRWTLLVIGVTLIALLAGWMSSELPRMHALLGEQQRLHEREMTLREQLQDSYAEQQVLVAQQQELLAEVDRLYREQAQVAVTDAITGLPNHRAIMSRLEEEISYCQRTDHSCAILFVDLDHFKRINDTWGHRAGDAILREVGARLRATLRLEDVVGRYGGEEFAIILPGLGIGNLDGVKQVAERLRAAVANEPCFWEVENMQEIVPITVTTSIGVAVYQLHGVTREELIEHADHAMYQAKHSGRNCVCVADVETLPAIGSNGHKAHRYIDGLSRDVEVAVAGTLQVLTEVASAHDRNTNEHVHRMVKLAEATAQELQQPEEELHLIRLAALFHDIGKVGIPDAILHKPGPLTPEEWVVMRRHPEIGRHILAQAGGIFEQLSHIVAAHHERWDGKGYPAGLAGEDIPISARIITVVDSYDGMISPRPYREPLSVEAARAELLRCAGSQYDPQVVEAFLSVLGESVGARFIEPSADLSASTRR